jgi:hypothetical protein
VFFVFFALYIVASVFVINDYFDKLRKNKYQLVKLERLQKQLENARQLLFRSEQRLAVMEGYINNVKPGIEIYREPQAEETESLKVEPADEMRADEEFQEEPERGMVEIKDVATSKEDAKLTVSFKIVNIGEGEKPLRGYVHIVVTDKGTDTPQCWTYPKVALRDGLPIEYKRGRLFVIKRFRTIHGEFFIDSKTESPLSLKILVYNQSGNLILQKELEEEIVL